MNASIIFDFKVVKDEDRIFQSVEIYNDKIDERYSYDDKVPNHKNIQVGDRVIIRDKKIILGTSTISNITVVNGKKDLKYCPFCDSYEFSSRKLKKPLYRCENGHEFDMPKTVSVASKKYTANYAADYISLEKKKISINILEDYYIKFNKTNSINKLEERVLEKLSISNKVSKQKTKEYSLSAETGDTSGEHDSYANSGVDERKKVIRQIKARRGQQKFRNDLRRRYKDKCTVTGCEILDILEAAHIYPYRGENDNHPENGLLLRSDIHTLFDLNLIGVEPFTLKVHINERIKNEYSYLIHKKLICSNKSAPSKDALEARWKEFNAKLN